MISNRDGHIRVLPIHVANKIAAGEVVERPASVVKELLENAIDAGARKISVAVTQGGRKLVAVQDDGCGMNRDDATLCLERQATSKIRDVTDIEEIDTLGFRGEAIPSIAAVSRFTITTRCADSDEGTLLQVNAGTIAEIRTTGCPVGTRIDVRDLFCNVPARRKFLRSCLTEENHIKHIFTVHALAHPSIAFSLTIDEREIYRLAPTHSAIDRIRDLFGIEFAENLLPIQTTQTSKPSISGFIERPNRSTPSRRDQYIFVNGRPATTASIAYALKEAYPRQAGDSRPAAIIFITLPPNQVDVNVHPTKREVRFRDNFAVKNALIAAIEKGLESLGGLGNCTASQAECEPQANEGERGRSLCLGGLKSLEKPNPSSNTFAKPSPNLCQISQTPSPVPTETEFVLSDDGAHARPWQWFNYLAQSASGYLLVETDAGIVTINPHAARERIAYERMLQSAATTGTSQTLLIPETITLPPLDFARIKGALDIFRKMGFQLEEFGRDTFKIEALPQQVCDLPPATLLTTIANDLTEGGTRHGGERWREERIAKSIARSFAGASLALTKEGAIRLIEELCACKMPYVCPRGKPVMIFTSTRELNRKFDR